MKTVRLIALLLTMCALTCAGFAQDKKQVVIQYDSAKTTEEALKKAIEALEFTCEKAEEQDIAEKGKNQPDK
jgi:DNA-directed RNA polymerase subunit L